MTERTTERIWLITGASSGFGRALADAVVAAGDRVIGAARRPDALGELATKHPDSVESVQLDVTDPDAIAALIAQIEDTYGRIDVLVNNAGHGQVGAVEETTDRELRDLFELHLFGPTALIKAVLPGMRAQGRGAIVQMSSMGGQIGVAGFSAYSATKFALEGLSESLAAEVAPFGIRVLVVEPGAFRTSFSGGGLLESEPMDAYTETVGATRDMIRGMDGQQPGDPAKAAEAILAALAAEEAPLRLPLGPDAVDGIVEHGEGVLDEVRAWEGTARNTAFADAG
jgi:NAD(P)-dependent dehydrogenase (short-subunit alcohol dehydrogenase family)